MSKLNRNEINELISTFKTLNLDTSSKIDHIQQISSRTHRTSHSGQYIDSERLLLAQNRSTFSGTNTTRPALSRSTQRAGDEEILRLLSTLNLKENQSDNMKRKSDAIEDGEMSMCWSPSSNESLSSPQKLLSFSSISGQYQHNQRLTGQRHMNLRTRKRFRDNRPDEDAIHKATLAKLFSAQQQATPPDQHFVMMPDVSLPESNECGPVTMPERSQRDLHSFFAIKSQPVKPQQRQLISEVQHHCEDCGNRLCGALDSTMLDVEMIVDQEYACYVCSRHVCDICAVRGKERICLECVMPGCG